MSKPTASSAGKSAFRLAGVSSTSRTPLASFASAGMAGACSRSAGIVLGRPAAGARIARPCLRPSALSPRTLTFLMPLPPALLSRLPIGPVAFLGEMLAVAARGRWRFRARDLGQVAADCSARAVPIVTVVNLLVGAILAFVGAVQLRKFGAGLFVADLVGIAVTREMAAIITAVVMAGRTGAAFAAELATMQANEEIDALDVLGLPAADFLVLPRVAALLVALPLLYAYACLAGLAGGLLVSIGLLDVSAAGYLQRTAEAMSWTHPALGAAKALVFGATVGLVGCYCGLNAQRNAAGVGAATTRSVVTSIVAIIVIDAVFAVCANALDL